MLMKLLSPQIVMLHPNDIAPLPVSGFPSDNSSQNMENNSEKSLVVFLNA